MTPTLFGRIQTRLFLLGTVGVIVTVIVSPFLPVEILYLHDRLDVIPGIYAITFGALAIVAALGVLWELLYHLLQQLRWDKDWPTPIALLVGFSEAAVAWWVLRWIGPKPFTVVMHPPGFFILFAAVWVSVFLAAQGPMRVMFVRWRFRGGRVIGRD